jgi:hypothetical protein
MFIYDKTFDNGIQVHLSVYESETGYLLILDHYTGSMNIIYFVDVNTAYEYIKNTRLD